MVVLDPIGNGLWNAVQMAWEVGWALVLGFSLSGIVQAWVPRSRMESALGGRGVRELFLSTTLGAASSSCSYAAIAIAKSLFQKGASFASAMAFQFASTNLVFEIGIVMWIFLGWEFTLAEFVGGIFLIALMWGGVRLFITRRLEEAAREHALGASAGHEHHMAASEQLTWRQRLTSVEAWSDVAHNFRGDWAMLWKEITGGFLIAGFIALLPMSFFNGLFITNAPAAPRLLENVALGPVVAALSFVCSVGNVPLAAVLWAGGISFSGVIAFIYADLIIVPIVLAYRKYYGWTITWRIVAIMFATMVLAALAVDGIFAAGGLIPKHRPSVDSITSRGIEWNYTTALNIVFLLAAAALFSLTVRRGAKDPVCGMTVDRHKTPHRSVAGGRTVYFCGAGCKAKFDADPDAYLDPSRREAVPAHGGHDHS
ncbi:MAG: YHS domain-containing protein [Actinobacteria bacterium]|nr:MAG: YHS domain-containing protein [Actinomycetota bacterium]